MACNGSKLLGGTLPPTSDDPSARNEGTAAHWVVHECWRRGCKPDDFLNQKAPNGVTITNSITKNVVEFVQYAQSLASEGVQGMEADCSFGEIGARCDHFMFDGAILRIDDFKFGFRIVEPKENWTFIAYAIGLCVNNNWTPQGIVISVHQPRVPHPEGTVREWRLSYAELMNRYEHLQRVMLNPDANLHTGPHCDRCPSATICPALRTAVFNAIDVSMTAHSESITDDRIAAELALMQDAEKRLKSRKKQIEDLAVYRMRQGAVIDGYAMERSYSNRAWHDGMTPEFLTMVLGVDCTRMDAISPAQAIAAGANEHAVNRLSERKETGLKLSRISATKLAEKLFGKAKG